MGDALTLVAAQLRGNADAGRARTKLIRAAAAVDLGIACDLAAFCAFARSEDADLRDSMIARINELASSTLSKVRDLGVIYQIASGFSEFAVALWPLLESDDHQTRLHTHRIAGSAISLAQLGAGAIQRIAGWSSERRAEFVDEIADNPDNYEFLVRIARDEPDPTVRAAAISSLFWHFPASDVPMQAWLTAPIAVQSERDVLVHVQYALEDGHVEEAVKERLLSLAPGDASDGAQVQLALASPDDVPAGAVDAILRGLRNDSHHPGDLTALVDIARNRAPDRLLALAREIALTVQRMPDWAREYLHSAPGEVRHLLFEEAWNRLQGQDFADIRAEFFGPLADLEQIDRCITAHLAYKTSARDGRTEADRERNRQLGDILAHASGEDLLQSVLNRSVAASYGEAVELLSLVMQRIGHEDGSNRNRKQWMPSVAKARQLVAAFADKTDTAEVPYETVRVYLSRIVSHVTSAEFGPFILDTCRRYLNAWAIYRQKVREWSQHRKQPRPNNPPWGHYLGLAVTQWGPDALPGLIELMDHPNAMDFVPETMAGVASLPWSSQRERMFSSVSLDICDGEERRKQGRVLRQPDDSLQHWTDRAAERLGQKLMEVIHTYQGSTAAGDTKAAREAEYRVGGLAAIVARVPSAAVLAPVYQALASGLMNLHGTVSALRSLVRHGQLISGAAAVAHVEAVYERTASARWHDDSTRYSMSEASALLLCAVPEGLRAKPVKHYVEQWRRFAHTNEIVRNLGSTRVEAAWPVLLEAASLAENREHAHEEVIHALVRLLMPRFLPSFFTLITDGRLFRWCRSAWTLEKLAPDIAAVLKAASEQLPAFVEACRSRRSPLADTLVVEVLSHIDGNEGTSVDVLLEALDAGRAATSNTPAFQMLRGMFTLHVPLGDSSYEVRAKSSNELRSSLYTRAKGAGPNADASKRLLASVECGRREHERPLDEPRHPAVEDDLPWTDALRSRQQT